MSAPPFDLAVLKDDIGMPPGTENDAWLQRRVDGVWARIESYCNRHLGAITTFQDIWDPAQHEQNVSAFWPYNGGVVYFLRHYPVHSVTAVLDNGGVLVPGEVAFNPHNGALTGYGPAGYLSRFILPTVTYTAGYDPVPADLYESMVGILQSMWNTRANAQSGLATGGMLPSQIDITDVGSIVLGAGNMGFVAPMASGQSADYSDPLLGPYSYVFDQYRDIRAEMGSVLMPVTITLGVTP